MFVTADSPTAPEAAWFKVNDPIKDFDRIQRLVREGFLVRTRADADTRQSRANDGTQRDKAMASGAAVRQHRLPRAQPSVLRLPRRLLRRHRGAGQSRQRRSSLGKQRPGKPQGKPRSQAGMSHPRFTGGSR